YAGYRDKERRRDSDRVVRERLALEYGQLAERLGRLATSLAQDRQIAAMPLVDRPHKRLVSFIEIGRASCRERGAIGLVALTGRRRHTRFSRDWSSDVCSSDLTRDIVIRSAVATLTASCASDWRWSTANSPNAWAAWRRHSLRIDRLRRCRW